MSANTIMKEFMQPPLQSIDKVARVKQRDVLLVGGFNSEVQLL